ncbi:MAG: hypothetical protein LBJ08_12665, partial [Bifidobacteriaceae bacterium]|nr:hypothetical protein [Bifidobacteriaceae bacterium]
AETQVNAPSSDIWEQASARFLDPEAQLRWEISLAWVLRTAPQEKETYPLPDYAIGRRFVQSLDKLQGVARTKVLDVIVDVLTKRDKDLSGRRLHRLRTGSPGGAPARQRGDGAQACRVAIQRGTPAARQLHYWKLPSGKIELDQVGVHDQGLA